MKGDGDRCECRHEKFRHWGHSEQCLVKGCGCKEFHSLSKARHLVISGRIEKRVEGDVYVPERAEVVA